jgi:hypothetical protein
MLGLSAEAYVLRAVGGVRANDLEQALLLLPFADALKLLQWVAGWLAQGNQVGAELMLSANRSVTSGFWGGGYIGGC